MSNKKPSKNQKDMLDDSIVESTNQSQGPENIDGKEISLQEYSKNAPFSFNSKNYKLLLAGLAINILGFIFMIGGGTDDPTKFDGDALFSTMRITVAPIFIVAGYIVIMYAIMKRPKTDQQ